MVLWQATALGVIEGLTEFIPVSSTGHLILAGRVLGLGEDDSALKAFDIIIQGAAMLAVIILFYKDLSTRIQGVLRGDSNDIHFALNIIIAVFPSLLLGFLFSSKIKAHLFGVMPVIAALAVGGVVLIAFERLQNRRKAPSPLESQLHVQTLSPAQAFKVGLFQCFALWPGTSRSMSTILGARWIGLRPVDAAYFSFLMAIPTLLAATAYDLLKNFHLFSELGQEYWVCLAVGSLVSFVVSYLVMKVFLSFLKSYSLEVFGWYRLVIALLFWLTFR